MIRIIVGPVKRWTVLHRDNFICQKCGVEGKFYDFWNRVFKDGEFSNLNIHHIADPNDNSFNNLISLCDPCHFNAHGNYWKNKTKEYFTVKPITKEIIETGKLDFYRRKEIIENFFRNIIKTEDLI